MQIQVNKDIEEEYRNELMKGFTLRELVYLVAAVVVIAAVCVLVWKKGGVQIDVAVFAGIPFGCVILFFGFRRYQGLTVYGYLKEMLYEHRTRTLAYEGDGLPEQREVFTMERRTGSKRKWRLKR